MSVHFVFRLIPPRPTFTQDMTAEERATMDRHAAHWQPQIDAGKMVVFGPVLGEAGAWGLGVLEADSEEEALALTGSDPAVTEGVGRLRGVDDARGLRTAVARALRPGAEDWRLRNEGCCGFANPPAVEHHTSGARQAPAVPERPGWD